MTDRPRLLGVRGVRIVAAVVLLAGCAGPRSVPGTPEPLSAPGATAPTPTPTPSRPAPVATPSGTPVLPTAYVTHTLQARGVTLQVPVPATWSLDRTEFGVDLGDPSGRLLLRLEIRPVAERDAVRGWEAYEPTLKQDLDDYRRIDLSPVAGVGDSAADLRFTFGKQTVRQVIDRGIVAGDASIAVYFSAEQRNYAEMLPVFGRAVGGLTITGG